MPGSQQTGSQYGFSLAAGSYTENVHFAFINSAQNGGEWFDSKGNPTGIKLYNPWGFYVSIHSPDLIYFCSFGFRSFSV